LVQPSKQAATAPTALPYASAHAVMIIASTDLVSNIRVMPKLSILFNVHRWQFGRAIASSTCANIEFWIINVSNNLQPRWQSPIRIWSTC
jgi:hypothetical protein